MLKKCYGECFNCFEQSRNGLNFNYENLNEDDAKSLGVWWDTD